MGDGFKSYQLHEHGVVVRWREPLDPVGTLLRGDSDLLPDVLGTGDRHRRSWYNKPLLIRDFAVDASGDFLREGRPAGQ